MLHALCEGRGVEGGYPRAPFVSIARSQGGAVLAPLLGLTTAYVSFLHIIIGRRHVTLL